MTEEIFDDVMKWFCLLLSEIFTSFLAIIFIGIAVFLIAIDYIVLGLISIIIGLSFAVIFIIIVKNSFKRN